MAPLGEYYSDQSIDITRMLMERYVQKPKEYEPSTVNTRIDMDKMINIYVDQKYVNIKARDSHGNRTLYLFNYTPKCVFDRAWNNYTMAARGLITDEDGNIVLRPFQKFFNVEEWKESYPSGHVEVYEKVDGSLITAGWTAEDGLIVASRGSFDSDQAKHARDLIVNKYGQEWIIPNLTYVFEVVYPENRIVVNYGNTDELVLLGVQETNGEGWSHHSMINSDFPFRVAEQVATFPSMTELLEADLKPTIKPNSEGYVIRFSNEFRLKLKGDEYLRLHRIVTNTNSKTIWEMCKDGRSFEDLITNVPDEFMWWVKQKHKEFTKEFKEIDDAHKGIFNQINSDRPRTQFAAAVEDYTRSGGYKKFHRGIMYAMKDNKSYDHLIWATIKPIVAEKPPVGETTDES
jgi:RNA ligase